MEFYRSLSTARVVIGEIMTGYDREDYHSWIIGHLTCAQEHVLELDEEFALKIRDLRLKWYPEGSVTCRFTHKDMREIKELLKEARGFIEQPKVQRKFKGVKKPCGCGGKK